jgi:hypothetical protein
MRHLNQLNAPTIAPNFVKAGSTITVTIGRNIGDSPMSEEEWQDFQASVTSYLSNLVRPERVFTYLGEGEWQGVVEESACILFIGNAYTTAVENVDRVLSVLAKSFNQDAIGWSAGQSHLARRGPLTAEEIALFN